GWRGRAARRRRRPRERGEGCPQPPIDEETVRAHPALGELRLCRRRNEGGPDAVASSPDDPSSMQESYGVVWREGTGPLGRGKLELHPRLLRLDGLAAAGPACREIAYGDLALVRVGRAPTDRIS